MHSTNSHRVSREVFHTKGIHVGVEDHTVSFGYANSQRSISTQQCVISFGKNGGLKLKFSIIEDGQAPFLFSLPQCLKLGARLIHLLWSSCQAHSWAVLACSFGRAHPGICANTNQPPFASLDQVLPVLISRIVLVLIGPYQY
eukprot:5132172-Amphidinium_carterae.1